MMIKHMPSGLFPHFDSALERRPYFVKAGDRVTFGCRLDDSDADRVWLEITNSNEIRAVAGEYRGANDRNQRYFQFVYQTHREEGSFSYRFVTSRGESSRRYSCPILRELTLYPQVEKHTDSIYFNYRTDTQQYRIEISRRPCICLIFRHNLTVKITKKQENSEHQSAALEEVSSFWDDGDELFRMHPALRLALDETGTAHYFSLGLDFPGQAVYGCGEKFDRVNQKGKKPLNYVVEQFANQQDKTYLPIPFLFTDGGVSFLQRNSEPSRFDFSKQAEPGWIAMELFAVCPEGEVLFDSVIRKGTPAQLLKAYTEDTAVAVLPPKWAFGPWMSSNGWNTQTEALEQIRQMRETAIPATVMVLEAWSDEETFYIWNDAIYTPRKDGGPIRYSDFTLERIPVFVRAGCAIPVNMNRQLCMGTRSKEGALSNNLERYENLCFLLYGAKGRQRFQDEMGNDILLAWDSQEETAQGSLASPITLLRMDGRGHGSARGKIFGREIHGTRKEQP